ncbi:Fe-S cluster domain protein [Desulfofundulus kuznetsovii DSM 6115]|uniref:Fe-S cluster domain protein n=1 Tax=Desulfofundulus kuznetsovii (strain DSM 6115 / VKM B-1805 / 17) TaxID=760568 RepID=A0AAU8PDV4_DESK7|nr:Fe-S cluster domain protein [Desulfofundulus kuznetsovii DSM 6115]
MFEKYSLKLVRPQCHPSRLRVNAIVELDVDIREIFPYLNAELGNCFYHPEAPFLRFAQGGKVFTLHPSHFTINGLEDEEQAHRMVEFIRKLLEDTWARRGEIVPSFRRGTELKVLDVYKLLPRTNCGNCGEKNCMAFAARLIKQEFTLADCTPLQEPAQDAAREKLTRLLQEAGYPV